MLRSLFALFVILGLCGCESREYRPMESGEKWTYKYTAHVKGAPKVGADVYVNKQWCRVVRVSVPDNIGYERADFYVQVTPILEEKENP